MPPHRLGYLKMGIPPAGRNAKNDGGLENGTFPKGRKDGRITYWLESEIQRRILETAEAAGKN